ncbi:hypothetical protein N0V94_008515 [Neodidymelliopsis sp. IMI 364377]|nr:hypothetical protein N0V94_008515 [Neodidymelliopsis sp. IMI 364377]
MNPSRSSFDAPPPHSNNYIFQDFNQAHPSTPKASGKAARKRIQPLSEPNSARLAEQPDISSNHFTPYRGLFNDSTEARNHRHHVTRFGRQPYVAPANDPSIDEIEKDRQYQVGRIYGAMVRGDRAQDNPGSIAVKRWVHPGAHYKSDLIEAFAHKVFDSLMAQVKEGFRGWHHNDYVEDDRKGEKDDRDVDCLGRLDNIIDALEREKTICEDVMNSASQIRMFVNAPIAYAMRKYQNRVGFSEPVCATVEPILPSGDFLFTETPWLNNIDLMQTDNSLNHHHHDSTAGGVSLADLEHQISQPAEHGTDECPNFETLWNNQPGVQQFSFQPRDSDQNQS